MIDKVFKFIKQLFNQGEKMDFSQVLALIAELQKQIEALKDMVPPLPISQADLDKAVVDQKAMDQVVIDGLQAELDKKPADIMAAIQAEDAKLAEMLKPVLDALMPKV